MSRRALCFIVLPLLALSATANTISFDERFALAKDRSVPLKDLIEGTEEYYYYHALYYQQLGNFAQAREMIDAGIKKYKRTGQFRELEHRQALLTYDQSPDATMAYLRDQLKPNLSHQRKQLRPEVKLPTELDPATIDTEQLLRAALGREARHVERFEDRATEWLVRQTLNADQRRSLLQRLKRADYPAIVDLIAADLAYRHSTGFGKMAVHHQLLQDQLEALLVKRPELIKDTPFINIYISKLQPSPASNWRQDEEELLAYLQRLEAFAKRLPPAQNSLKANVSYQRLLYERRHGRYDRDRFMQYLRYPRAVHYINPDYRKRPEFRGLEANLNTSFEAITSMPPIGLDEPLVRDHLMHFLKDADDAEAFSDYIESNYLKRCFAETKLVNSIGDQAQWFAMLNPAEVKRLRDRIDIDLLPTNPTVIGTDDDVALDVAVKNVKELRVKVYALNTRAFYKQHGRDVSTDIDLDGLVPNHERVLMYDQPFMRRHVERLSFPELKAAGTYVVELIGNGVSSRALVRKGLLRFALRVGAAGHVVRVFDEAGTHLTEATVWTGGREYRPDEEGDIVIPFAGSVQEQKMVLMHGDVASLWKWVQQAESYELSATLHVERESLVAGEMSRVVIRPRLWVSGIAADVGLVENPVLTIRSTDIDGISAEKQIHDLELHNDKETVCEFRTPQRLQQLSLSLAGKVRNLNQGRDDDVASHSTISVNQIAPSEKIENLFLRHTADGFVVELRGRNGEPLADRPVSFQIKNRYVREDVKATLKTDEKGRIGLGELKDIDWVRARGTESSQQLWAMPRDAVNPRSQYAVAPGETLYIPYVESGTGNAAADLSLIERRGGVAVRDMIDRVTIENGYVIIRDLPAGDYRLEHRTGDLAATITVDPPIDLQGKRTRLNRPGLQIGGVIPEEARLRVQVLSATPDTRVHVMTSRFHHDRGHGLMAPIPIPTPDVWRGQFPESVFLSGRRLGDEYRYVMERRSGEIFPGNMLTRPRLLLNPWKLRDTSTGRDDARGGEDWARTATEMRSGKGAGKWGGVAGGDLFASAAAAGGFVTLDFLAAPCVVLPNLVPDEDGMVDVPLEKLGDAQQIHIVAINADSGVYRELAVKERAPVLRERRLVRALDPTSHYTQQKRIDVVRKGEAFTIDDILSAEFEVYDSLDRIYTLLTSLNDDPTLAEFSFVLGWTDLSKEEKLEKYSTYACHELSYFVYRHDPEFFKTVVAPYLANKKDRTFVDEWLLDKALDDYLQPWRYGRLNIAERVLLGQRVPAERAAAARHVRDRYDLIPPNLEQFNTFFRSALRSRGLDDGETLDGLKEGLARAEAAGYAARRAAPRASAAPEPMLAMQAAKGQVERLAKKSMSAERELKVADFKQELGRVVDAPAMRNSGIALADEADATSHFFFKAVGKDRAGRHIVRQLYRKLGPTAEWAENNYYHLPIDAQVGNMIPVNGFWKDYAEHDGDSFVSRNVAEASRSFAEMMLALASLDVPFDAAEHETTFKLGRMTLIPGGNVLVFHKQVSPAESVAERQVILVSQNYFAQNDRYRHENNERFDKFVTEAFEASRVYGCQVVLTNPTSTRRKVDILTQIPAGAIPVLRGQATRTQHLALEPYSTQTFEYFFYFPSTGTFGQYPVHVSQAGEVIAFAAPFAFEVVKEVSDIDKQSWEHVSQFGSDADVLTFLEEKNADRLDLNQIAFRMRDKDMFRKATDMLRARHIYSDTLWAYGLHHKDNVTVREYLPSTQIANQCGRVIDSPLLVLDPVHRHVYQHKEYWPLVNARVYRLGRDRKILNRQFFEQYMSFLENLRYRHALTDDDHMTLAVYLLVQDRVGEALAAFEDVQRDRVATTIQYDYMNAYLAFYRETPGDARKIAEGFKDYPVPRWRKLFAEVLAQCDEIEGRGAAAVVDDDSRTQNQAQLADTEPQLNLAIENQQLRIEYANLDSVTFNIYPMDVELLFSRKPFVQDVGDQFAMIQPNEAFEQKLDRKKTEATIDIPRKFRDRNVMIEAVSAGISRREAYYPSVLRVDMIENYGQVRVQHAQSGKALPKIYVKVYARMPGGNVQFFKDGYTDLRGKFDYASLNTGEITSVERFSVLVLSDELGAVVREAAPPSM